MMLYLLLNVKLRNLLQPCHFLCRNRISAAALCAPVRTSSRCVSEWVYCSSKLSGEAEQRHFMKKKIKINSSHISHMNSFFLKKKKKKSCSTSEQKLQIVNFRSLPSSVPLSCPRPKRRRESTGQLRCDHSFSFRYTEVMGRPSQDRWFVCALVSQRTHTLAKQNHYQQ